MPDFLEKMTQEIQDSFRRASVKLKASLSQGLPVRQYQIQEVTHRALVMAQGILECFGRDIAKYCANPRVMDCLELIADRHENRWVDLSEDERLRRMIAAIGFLADDMGFPADAEALFEMMATMEPDNIYALLGVAYVKLFNGSAPEALEIIRHRVLNIAPGSDLGLAYLALAYEKLNRNEEALAAASAVITANRDEEAVAMARKIQTGLGQPAVSDYRSSARMETQSQEYLG